MARLSSSRIIPVVLVIIIVAVTIAALISLTRAVFFSSTSTTENNSVDISKVALLSTTSERSVRLTVRGPIVADELFHSYQITISPSSRMLNTYSGYLAGQVDQLALTNNIPAYEQFVYALDKANLVKGAELTGDKNDTRGICATGRVYQFEVIKADNIIKDLWTSTCKGSVGSLDADVDQLTDLFIDQLPSASTLIRKVKLQ